MEQHAYKVCPLCRARTKVRIIQVESCKQCPHFLEEIPTPASDLPAACIKMGAQEIQDPELVDGRCPYGGKVEVE
ncbi:MAG: hypothetical protein FH749_06925 [Firmicutes bacterium]|nr:hypothetical protein [Bacillota bacterium]